MSQISQQAGSRTGTRTRISWASILDYPLRKKVERGREKKRGSGVGSKSQTLTFIKQFLKMFFEYMFLYWLLILGNISRGFIWLICIVGSIIVYLRRVVPEVDLVRYIFKVESTSKFLC